MSTIPDSFEPKSANSNYLRLTPGQHRIRILSDAIAGWEYWEDTPEGGRKPIRLRLEENPPVEHAEEIKKFLAFVIWNYEIEKIQVMEITQASIQRELKAYEKDKEWGDLKTFDLTIERTGNDKNTTKYRVSPKPHSELGKEIEKAVKEGLPVLEALFKGENPFEFNNDATESLSDKELDQVFKG
jgi:hypothetical protein